MDAQPIARIVPIEKLSKGNFQKKEGWNSSYLDIDGKKIQRINMVGTVIRKDSAPRFKTLLIDDGTGTVSLRIFDEHLFPQWEAIDEGTLVRTVGNVREYQDEIYLVPLFMRHLSDPAWAEVQRKRWSEENWTPAPKAAVEKEKEVSPTNYLEIIRKLDTGNGASVAEIEKALHVDDPKALLDHLITQGEIFEIRPGFVKTLY